MRQRRGFTLLEMMVVVGVLLLLVTIAVAAYSKIINTMAAKATGTALENAQSVLAEYEQSNPISSMGFLGAGLPDPNFPYLGGNHFNSFNTEPRRPIGPGGTVASSGVDRYPSYPGATSPIGYQPCSQTQASGTGVAGVAVYNSAAVMMVMMRVPAVAQQVNKLPPKALLTENGQPITIDVSSGGRAAAMPAPLLVDGWNNPIIFVPASGLRVNLKQGQYIVRTSGMISDPTGNSTPNLKTTDRPFWASAGPDGRLDSGDDNIYSFKQ